MNLSYATPSAWTLEAEQCHLAFSSAQERPLRWRGKVRRNAALLRFALRALGEIIWYSERAELLLDPIVSVHPDRILFEAFSSDQGAYGLVSIDPAMFEIEGEVVYGTTNIDFSAWLWNALGEIRSYRATTLTLGGEGMAVETSPSSGRFEPRVELPLHWLRGFLELHSALQHPARWLKVKPVDLLAPIRFLRHHRGRVSPRALRYLFEPDKDVRIVMEPWEESFWLRDCPSPGTAARAVRVWGRQRLRLIEPLLPFARSCRVGLLGRGLPHFYQVEMPDITFTLGLSGWGRQSWTEEANFSLLHRPRAIPAGLLERLEERLKESWTAAIPSDHDERAAMAELIRRGKAMFDPHCRRYRYRPLLLETPDLDLLYPTSWAEEQAELCQVRELVVEPQDKQSLQRFRNAAGVSETRQVMLRDFRLSARVDGLEVEVVVSEQERILFARCGCDFFQQHLLSRGPCPHVLAVFRDGSQGRLGEASSGTERES